MIIVRRRPHEAHTGDTLTYKLRPEDLPTNPDQFWHGLIKQVFVDTSDHSQQRYYLVQSIEHPDCEELVRPAQVTGFQPRDQSGIPST